MIKEIIGLKNEYLSVRISEYEDSYGGNQDFFAYDSQPDSNILKEKGCGMVAMHDVYCYLSKKYHFESVSDYRLSLERVSHEVKWSPGRFGTLNISIPHKMKILLNTTKNRFSVKWGLSIKYFNPRLQNMLANDIPVIICIPFLFKTKTYSDQLPLYVIDENGISHIKHFVSAHFVVVTGIVACDNKTYYRVSSWGQKLYIDSKEYQSFIKHHAFGWYLGNLLLIKDQK